MTRSGPYVCVILLLLCGCKDRENATGTARREVQTMTIQVSSSAFKQGGMIPRQYTGDGQDISPPLHWEQIPKGNWGQPWR